MATSVVTLEIAALGYSATSAYGGLAMTIKDNFLSKLLLRTFIKNRHTQMPDEGYENFLLASCLLVQ